MSEKFVPEMHDLGKLVNEAVVESLLGVKLDSHYLRAEDKSDLDFAKIGVAAPSSLTWIAVQHHSDHAYERFTDSPLHGQAKVDVLLTALADKLAASSSRATPETKGEHDYNASYKRVHCLWNPRPQPSDESWSPIRTMQDLRDMIAFVNGNPDAAAFFSKYHRYLERIPEHKNPPRVVTSLLTHLALVGKYYRVLKKHAQVLTAEGEPSALEYAHHGAGDVWEMLGRWQYQLVKCRLAFPQMPVRVRDLNVLALLETHTKELVASEWRDYVLFHTTDTLYLVLPTDGRIRAEQILKPYLDDGFFVETEQVTAPLAMLNPAPKDWKRTCEQQIGKMERAKTQLEGKLAGARREYERLRNMSQVDKRRFGDRIPAQGHLMTTLEKDLEDTAGALERWKQQSARFDLAKVLVEQASIYAEPIVARTELDTDLICELCQMQPAIQVWRTPDETLEEHLCEVCYRVRNLGETHGALGRWERDTPNVPVAWVRLSLDYDWALMHIMLLFDKFVDELMLKEPKTPKSWATDAKASLRPLALLADFTADYQRFTQRFAALLREGESSFKPNDIVELTSEFKDFCIIRMWQVSDVARIIEAFRCALDEFFPKALEECPVRLTVSIANVKHPFFEHWRFCQAAPDVINIQLVGRALLNLSAAQYDLLKTVDWRRREVSTFLHRVAAIEAETHSRILPQVEFVQNRRKLPEIASALENGMLRWSDVLDYYKMARG